MSLLVAVLLIAALLAASAWTVLVAIAGAVEVLPSFPLPESEEGGDEISAPGRRGSTARSEAA
jgi:hypothetical protein